MKSYIEWLMSSVYTTTDACAIVCVSTMLRVGVFVGCVCDRSNAIRVQLCILDFARLCL